MEADEFQIGGRYRNQKGGYEVLAMDGPQMHVRYDSGAEEKLERAFQARVMSRIEREEASAFPPGLPNGKQADFAWTLGVIASRGQLHAEVPPQAQDGFLAAYRRVWPGKDPPQHYYPISEGGENKWGSELRIYFPEHAVHDPRFVLPEGINVREAPIHEGFLRVNNNGLWWHLVERLGFRSGEVQDIAAIRARLPEAVRESFDEGSA